MVCWGCSGLHSAADPVQQCRAAGTRVSALPANRTSEVLHKELAAWPSCLAAAAPKARLLSEASGSSLQGPRSGGHGGQPAKTAAPHEYDSEDARLAEEEGFHPRSSEGEDGPTVPRDTSASATELKAKLRGLAVAMTRAAQVFALLGIVQVADALWSALAASGGPPAYSALLKLLPAITQSFALAVLAYRAAQPISFLLHLEERSRLRVLTLALQAIAGLRLYFKRTTIVAASILAASTAGLASQAVTHFDSFTQKQECDS
eukprot:SM000042S15399  [mRNA]  locus=s42:692189:693259:+ [translate_table: standard]